MLGLVHKHLVYQPRIEALTAHIAQRLPEGAAVLDVGCGDGLLDAAVARRRPDVRIEGIDVLLRPHTHIPVTVFDGRTIPFPDRSFDVVTFVDVLHHTEDPTVLLREAARVARRGVVIKDHLLDAPLSMSRLRFMDWVGNARHGVVLPYNYWPTARWQAAFREVGLRVEEWTDDVPLYPWPLSAVFGASLHVVCRLGVSAPGTP